MKGITMGLFTNLIFGIISLLLTVIDILCFFLLVNILCLRLNIGWLNNLKSVGNPFVEWFMCHIEKILKKFSCKAFSRTSLLNIGMITLVFLRIFIVALFSKR